MKKVLYVATVDIHIKSFHLPYLKLLHDNNCEVHVATNGDEMFSNCDIKHHICVERSPFKLSNIKAIRELKKIIDKERFDIIHCHTPMGAVVARLAARKARKKYGTRVIYTAHGFHFYKGAPTLNWMLFYPIEKWLAKYTDTLITINKEDYELAKKKFNKRCHDINYVPGVGINTKKFKVNLSSDEKIVLKKSLGLKNDDYVLTCVARLDNNKNQGFLINVMEQLLKSYNNIHLLLVGPDELEGYYQNIVNEKKLDNNVHFLGKRLDIPNILSITDIIVSASKREGLPVNVMEAFAAGLPVVALSCRGMSDLIDNGVNGYIVDINDKESINLFVNKIVKISKLNDVKINDIKKNNLEKSKNYDLENILKNYKDVYFNKEKLMFIHGGAMIKESLQGKLYCGGSYSKEVWERYYSIASSVTVLFRKDEKKYNDEELISKFQPFYEKNLLCIIPNITKSMNPLKIIKNIIKCGRIIKNNVIESDIVVARVPSLVSYLAIKYAKKYNKKMLTEVVGCGFDALWNHSLLGKFLAIPEFLLQRHYVKVSRNVVYVSQKFLQKRYPTNGRSIGCSDVVINKIMPNVLDNRINKIKNINGNKIILGTVGAVNVDYKGQKYVIMAVSKLKNMGFTNYEYHIIGAGSQDRLKKIARKYNVNDQIVFTGPLPHDKVMEQYNKIDIYIQPSNAESHGRVILEAMSTACPCIGSSTGGIPEIVNNKYVFQRKNVNQLAELIKKMDINEMIDQATINYECVQYYQYEVINKRREEFYVEI